MASFITAGNATNGLQVSSDNTGILELRTGTGSGTTAVTIGTTQNAIFAGNVGIGTSSPGGKLDVRAGTGATLLVAADATNLVSINNYNSTSGFQDFKYAGSTHQFFTGTAGGGSVSERARITSGGDFLVGTTNSSLTAGTGFKVIGAANSYIGVVTDQSTNANSGIHLYSTGAGAYRFYVGNGGTIYATSTTITAISDQRLKENIQDIDVGLDKIMALKPRKFDWKEGKGKDKKGDRGWIAQEFEQVFPEMIDTWLDPAPEGEEPYKAVNADLIPVLVKAIQELNAKVEAQAAEIAALKAQP